MLSYSALLGLPDKTTLLDIKPHHLELSPILRLNNTFQFPHQLHDLLKYISVEANQGQKLNL